MQTLETIEAILNDVEYKPWIKNGFKLHRLDHSFTIQHYQFIPDCSGSMNIPTEQCGRKWLISKWMCNSEIVQTALTAILAFEEHEVRECMHYKGQVPYGPHIDVIALTSVCRDIDTRDEELYNTASLAHVAVDAIQQGHVEGDELQPGETA